MLYTSIVAERIGLRRSFAVIMAMSFALNFILALALLLQQPETRTIVVPPTLAAEREVWTFDEAGPGAPYLERWALSVLSHAASVFVVKAWATAEVKRSLTSNQLMKHSVNHHLSAV